MTVAAGFFWLKPVGRPSFARGPDSVADFSLIDHQGTFHQLSRKSAAKAVVIIGHGLSCPIVQKLSLPLNKLRQEYAALDVEILMINANTEDSRAEILKEAQQYSLDVPILLDPSQVVARELGLTRTAEAVVIDTRDWRIVYRGPISDRLDYGVDKQEAQNEYLKTVLNSMASGDRLEFTAVEAKGCLISYEKREPVAYAEIAPIIAQKCLNCHHQEGKFPPYFDSHARLRGWSAMIRETILTERMPPFSADPMYGKYSNDLSLTAREKRLLVDWLDQGAPRGKGTPDPLTNYRPFKPKLFKNRTPIFTARMQEPAPIPANGEVEYKYFEIAGPMAEDLWVDGMRVESTNPRQLHHEALMITPKPLSHYNKLAAPYRDEDEIRKNQDGDILNHTLRAMGDDAEAENDPHYVRTQVWGLGKRQPFAYKRGAVLFIPKGYYLILETHYMGTGRDETEQTTIHFYGSKTPPKRKKPFKSLLVTTKDIAIPPHEPNFAVRTRYYKFDRDMDVIAFLGHLHMRGRAIRLEEKRADGSTKIVMSIPNYYYGWQTGTGLIPDPPVRISAGSSVRAICDYDNSKHNPNNPDPAKTVRFGQTHDRTEMCKMNLQLRETL